MSVGMRVLQAAEAAGITVELEGEFLSLKAVGAPDGDLIDLLKRHKAEIIELLRGRLTENRDPTSAPRNPLFLRDGRVMHRFRATEIPAQPSPDTAVLLDKVRRVGVVLIGDGMEVHIVERWKGQLHRQALRTLQDNAGAVITVLRGEHRARVAALPPECVAVHDQQPSGSSGNPGEGRK